MTSLFLKIQNVISRVNKKRCLFSLLISICLVYYLLKLNENLAILFSFTLKHLVQYRCMYVANCQCICITRPL